MDQQNFDMSFYEFRKVLGNGGQGQVKSYQLKRDYMFAKDNTLPPLPLLIAVKIFNDTSAFTEEFRIYKKISEQGGRPNIIKIYGHYEQEGSKCLVMEEYEDDLENYIVNERKDHPCTDCEARHILSQIANGLKMLKDFNIFHRDLKPKNILLKKTSGNVEVILLIVTLFVL